MSDLISREAVINILKQSELIDDNELGNFLIEEVINIPTAYDVDKVVERLEEEISDSSQYGCEMEYRAGLYKAIEIVKSGGKGE